MHSREQYLERLREEYRKGCKKQKTRLLNEARKRTRLNRKVLIRKLARTALPTPVQRNRKRKADYDGRVSAVLVKVWEIFDYPCGQRLAPVLKRETERLRQMGELNCCDEIADRLKCISAKTIDRLLGHEKQVRHLSRRRHPPVHPLLYQKIPVKVPGEWDRAEIGNLQLDYVAHGGRSAAGEYIHTLSAAEIASGWWEGQAIAGRSQQATQEGLDRIRQRLPFRIKEIHPDNDSGMINDLLWRYCQKHKIRMSRSRPYQKNDNAWVEQRNWTHVRKIVGYRRYDNMKQLALMNELYALATVYKNFCQPTMRLKEKTRVGGKIHRVYDEPRTPYERLLQSGQLDRATRRRLRQQYESINPAELRRKIEKLRSQLLETAEGRESVARRHGPALDLSRKRGAEGT